MKYEYEKERQMIGVHLHIQCNTRFSFIWRGVGVDNVSPSYINNKEVLK